MAQQQAACGHCGQTASKRCGGCRNIQYCTAECQLADWQYHKLLCKSFADFAEKPSPDVRRAIFLPEDGDTPCFKWLPVESKEERKMELAAGVDAFSEEFGVQVVDSEPGSCLPADDPMFGTYKFENTTTLVCGKVRPGELLDHSIILLSWPAAGKKDAPNACLKRLAKGLNGSVKPETMKRPLMIVGMSKALMPSFTVDLDTSALTLALDAIIGFSPPGHVPEFARKSTGVKVNFDGAPSFEEIQIPARHPAFKSGEKSIIAERMGLPMNTWFYPATRTKMDPDGGANSNGTAAPGSNAQPATFDAKVLHLCILPASPYFGRIPPAMQDDKRSMLVVRPPSMGPIGLDIMHFTKLGKRFQDTVVPMLSPSQGGTPKERLAKVEAQMNQAKKFTHAFAKSFGMEGLKAMYYSK